MFPTREESGLKPSAYHSSPANLSSLHSLPSYPALKQQGTHHTYPGPSPDGEKGVARLGWLPGAYFTPCPCCH